MRRPHTFGAAGAVALLLAFSACSRQPESPSTRSAKAPLRWGGPKNIAMLPLIAEKKGFYRDAGLEAQSNYLQTGKIAMDAVVSGDLDAGVLVETNIGFIKFQPDANVKVLACIMRKHDDALVARADKGIRVPEDLYGKSIAIVPGTTSHRFADLFVDFYKLDRKRIQFINSSPPGIQAGLLNGSTVAGAVWEPYRYNVRQTLGHKVVQFNDPRIYTAYALIAARADVVKREGARLEAFLRALIKAEEFVRNNQKESIALLGPEIGMDAAVLEAVWNEYELKVWLDPQLEDVFKDTGAWAKRTQSAYDNLPVPSYADVLDASILRKVDSSRTVSSAVGTRP